MAELKNILETGVETAFSLFEEAVIDSIYSQTFDDGFEEVISATQSIRAIADSFSQSDLATLSFGDRIQPTDIKCLVPGIDFDDLSPETKDTIYLGERGDGKEINKTYTVVDWESDPLNIMYTFLLRNA